jgi:hypothetical protein
MTQQQKNTVLAFGIVAGLISLPMTWLTLRGATLEGGFGGFFSSSFPQVTIDVTAFNGSVTFFIKTPIWFVVGVAITANVLQLMHDSRKFAIPRPAEWLTAIFAVAWVCVAILTAMFSDKATLGIGALLGLSSAVAPVLCLAIPTAQNQKTEHVSNVSGEDADA